MRTFAKLLSTFEQRQYLFAAQCIWWIAALVQLDPALSYYLEYWRFLSEELNSSGLRDIPVETLESGIFSTPQDIQRRSVSIKSETQCSKNYEPDPLRRTRKANVNHLPITK